MASREHVFKFTLTLDRDAYERPPALEETVELLKDSRKKIFRGLRHDFDKLDYLGAVEYKKVLHIHFVIALHKEGCDRDEIRKILNNRLDKSGFGCDFHTEDITSFKQLRNWTHYIHKDICNPLFTPDSFEWSGPRCFSSNGLGYNSKRQKELRREYARSQAGAEAYAFSWEVKDSDNQEVRADTCGFDACDGEERPERERRHRNEPRYIVELAHHEDPVKPSERQDERSDLPNATEIIRRDLPVATRVSRKHFDSTGTQVEGRVTVREKNSEPGGAEYI
jgi:hypothetical protein